MSETTNNETTTLDAETLAPVQTEAPEPTEAEPTPEPGTSEDGHDDEQTPSREAARYRRQLRGAEAERDALRAQLTAWQRAAAEEAVRMKLAAPSLLWADGKRTPADLADEEGRIDPAKVSAAVAELEAEHGRGIRARTNYVPNEGRTASPTSSGGFRSAFAPTVD